MRRIVIVSYKFPPFNSGYGNQALAVLETISTLPSDLDFIVLTAKFTLEEPKKFNCRIKVQLFWNRLLPISPDRPCVINSFLFQIQVFIWLLKNYTSYDIIHCIASGPHYALNVIIAKLLKKRIIIKITGDRFFKFNELYKVDARFVERPNSKSENIAEKLSGKIFVKLFKKIQQILNGAYMQLIWMADVFIAVSCSINNQLIAHGIDSEKIKNIPNGVDSLHFYPLESGQEKNIIRDKLGLEKTSVIILYAGNLSYFKGVQDLIEVLQTLKPQSKILFLACGADSGYGSELLKSFAILNKIKNIKALYKGEVDNLNEYYQAADIFVLPSYFEGLPNVLLEAASSGLPLVATDIGGNRDIIEDGFCGFLYPPGDIEKLKQALELLISDKTLRINFGKMARKIAVDKYHLPIIANHYIELYRQI
jgi:glycosyltransferase involved in cell wall biosynthesis